MKERTQQLWKLEEKMRQKFGKNLVSLESPILQINHFTWPIGWPGTSLANQSTFCNCYWSAAVYRRPAFVLIKYVELSRNQRGPSLLCLTIEHDKKQFLVLWYEWEAAEDGTRPGLSYISILSPTQPPSWEQPSAPSECAQSIAYCWYLSAHCTSPKGNKLLLSSCHQIWN